MTTPFKPITREEAATILSVSLSTLDNMITSGVMPEPRTIGGSRRKYWHPDVFYPWLDQQLRSEPLAPSAQTPAATTHSIEPRKAAGRRPAAPIGIAEQARARNAARISALTPGSETD